MPTPESGALAAHFREVSALLATDPSMDLRLRRALIDQVHQMSAEAAGVSYWEAEPGSPRGIWCLPPDADPGPVILYLHGGGFVVQSVHSHRKLAGHLAAAARCMVYLLDYRQAPEHTYPAQIDDVEAAYRWLLDQGTNPEHVAFAGDSAGACLAVTSVARIRGRGLPTPAAILGFSPWFDLECTAAALSTNAANDVLVQPGLVQEMAAAYLGGCGAASDPAANPLHTDLSGFPPVYLTAGGDEALIDNGELFVQRARAAGVDAHFTVEPGQQHVFQFMVGRAAEADRSVAEAGSWIAARLGAPSPAQV